MAVVLAALGVFVYLRIGSTLLASIDQGLRGQATEAMTRLGRGQALPDRDAIEGASIAEVIEPGGGGTRASPARLPPPLGAATRRSVPARRAPRAASEA